MSTSHNLFLSIQIQLNGLSFCIANPSKQSINLLKTIPFQKKLAPNEVLNRLKSELEKTELSKAVYKKVSLIHHNSVFAIVPKALYDPNFKSDYLKFNTQVLHADCIAEDIVENEALINLYEPYTIINNHIFDVLGSFDYKHATTLCIESAFNQFKIKETPYVFIHVGFTTFEIVVLKDRELQLCNVFIFSTPEDFIYHVLWVADQLKLDLETVSVVLAGHIKHDDTQHKLLCKYIRKVEFVTLDTHYKNLTEISAAPPHYHYLILKSL